MSKNSKQTSAQVTSLAARTLSDPNASQLQRSLAASALAQSGTAKQTGAQMEDVAARALGREQAADTTKTLAASLVSQSNRQR